MFIFINGERKLMKLLHAEDGGIVMYVKRLEGGRFRLPAGDPNAPWELAEDEVLSILHTYLPELSAVISGPSLVIFREKK